MTPDGRSQIWLIYVPKNIGKTTMIGQVVEQIHQRSSDHDHKTPLIYCSFGTGKRGIVTTLG